MDEATQTRRPNAWWVGVVAGMASYIDSAALVATGYALVIYQKAIGITAGEIGVLSASLTFCVAIGALTGGRLGDRIGRRRVFLLTMGLIASGGAFLTFGGTFALLFVGIVLVGLGVGADLPVSLASIAEASRRTNRGAVIGLSNLLWSVGILASTGISAVVGGWGRIGGQILFGHLLVIAVIVLLLRLTVPESRSWVEARDERRRGVETIRATRGRARDLLRTPYLGALVALIVFYALTNLAANTAGQFNPLVAVNLAHVPVEVFSRVSIIGVVIGVIANLVFIRIVDGRLRLPFFLGGAVLLTVGYLVPAVLGFSFGSMIALVVLTQIGSAFAFEGIMKVWTQESFPTLLRASAQGAIVAVARVTAALLALVTPALLAWNGRAAYLVIAVLLAAGLVVGWIRFRRSAESSFDVEEREGDAPVPPKVSAS